MRQILIDLNNDLRHLYLQEPLKKGENLGTEIVFKLSEELIGYHYLIVFKLNDNESVYTPEIIPANNKVSYSLPSVLTSNFGKLNVELRAYETITPENTRVIKSAMITLPVADSLNGDTEISPEEYVPWYVKVFEQTNIATQKAQEAAQSASEALASKNNALASENVAKISENKAKQSETNAMISEFNVQTMYNDILNNYDTSELAPIVAEHTEQINQSVIKTATLDKSLSDFQRTLSLVNINQEAKQPISGYGSVSLPKTAANVIVSAGLKGMTLKNELNYNPETWAEWNKANITVENGMLVFDMDAESSVNTRLSTKFKPSTKYLFITLVSENDLTNGAIQITPSTFGNAYLTLISSGVTGFIKSIRTTNTEITSNVFRLERSASAVGTRIVIDKIWCYELPPGSQIETDAETLTADQLAIKYPYIQGGEYRSVPCAGRFKSKSKNLIPDDISKFNYTYKTPIISYNGDYTIINNPLTNDNSYKGYFVKAKPGDIFSAKCIVKKISGNDAALGATLRVRFLNKLMATVGDYNVSTTSSVDVVLTNANRIAPIDTEYAMISLISAQSTTNAFKDWQLEKGTTATSYESHQESYQYFLATENGQIAEARSLPNGVSDTLDRKRISKTILNGSENWVLQSINEYGIANFSLQGITTLLPNATFEAPYEGKFTLQGFKQQASLIGSTTEEGFLINNTPNFYIRILASKLATQNVAGLKAWLQTNPQILFYQLATEEIRPVQVSGTLLSYPSGTVCFEKAVADAGIYLGGISVLHQDLPIKELEKISKIDFMTGIETMLDVSQAVIASDRLSFTHPNLSKDDIAAFNYFYDKEGTEGEMTVEFYDSRYVIADSANGKVYQWKITATNGVPSISLVEV